MTSTAARAANQTAKAAAAPLAASPAHNLAAPGAHNTVAASGGSPTTSREPSGQWAATGAEHAARYGKPAPARRPAAAKGAKPAAPFAAVSMATRIPELAKWIAALPSFTFADAAAASAPSPCSQTVMAYTLPDARLTSALAELGYVMTAGGKNGYTVTPIETPVKRQATHAAKSQTGS